MYNKILLFRDNWMLYQQYLTWNFYLLNLSVENTLFCCIFLIVRREGFEAGH